MKEWHFGSESPAANWPEDENGNPVEPAFLEHLGANEMEVELELSLFRAYGIPVICRRPNDGDFGRLVLGFSGPGTDLFVPKTMLEDAMNIMSGDIEPEETEEEQ